MGRLDFMPAIKKDETKSKAIQALFPEETVVINGVDVLVYPMAVSQFRKFSDNLAKIMPTIVRLIGTKEDDEAWIRSFATAILPFAASDLVDIIDECCDIDLKAAPQHVLPIVAAKWVEVTFGAPEKLLPWRNLMTSLQARLPQITTSSTSSTPASPAGTTSAT